MDVVGPVDGKSQGVFLIGQESFMHAEPVAYIQGEAHIRNLHQEASGNVSGKSELAAVSFVDNSHPGFLGTPTARMRRARLSSNSKKSRPVCELMNSGPAAARLRRHFSAELVERQLFVSPEGAVETDVHVGNIKTLSGLSHFRETRVGKHNQGFYAGY